MTARLALAALLVAALWMLSGRRRGPRDVPAAQDEWNLDWLSEYDTAWRYAR